ncbi:MAG: aspartate--tRNA ligase [Candidatus Puniceispirillum sp.]|nr:aspartate--tRNA ligase [Candidatus Puniceispirillum sp.]
MHPYRTHTCADLRASHVGQEVKLSGWVHRKRDHGNLLFVDLRDHFGMTQCVVEKDALDFAKLEGVRLESVVTLTGTVLSRTPETCNKNMATGDIELGVAAVHIESEAAPLPIQVNADHEFPEDTRLRYRFLDLRREKMHANIVLRSQIISRIRALMTGQGFLEIQTPILTASSPEGARDFLVPSRLHPGKFYALPQAPQQFKQLLMISGFDKYFQIAPCFRDEDARADRSPGEFYQLDIEMSFATQEDVFTAIEPVLHQVFEEFANGRRVSPAPFKRIAYRDAMVTYGNDKPDLRNPLLIYDLSDFFAGTKVAIFADNVAKGQVVRAIQGKGAAAKPRSFFEKLNAYAQELGAPGLGYVTFTDTEAKGPLVKFMSEDEIAALKTRTGCGAGDAVFFVCNVETEATKLSGLLRTKLGQELELIEENAFEFCWVVDFPMFEMNEETGQVDFSHNPFSMPQGGLEALNTKDPLDILAYQYDIVCNGIELCSGAIRNHLPEIMYKAFSLAGYSQEDVEREFGGMLSAFKFGAPPHGGCAPGIDRIVMLLAGEPNLREIVAFPLNQKAEDLLLGAPGNVRERQLEELHIRVKLPPAAK